MPSELRFVLALFVLAALAGVASVYGIYHQDAAQARVQAQAMTGGNVDAGKAAIARYNCGACHRIPGIPGATGASGPPLERIALRAQIAGTLTNDPDDLVRWLRHPQHVRPGSGMPEQGVKEREARDMAAYLYTLRQ